MSHFSAAYLGSGGYKAAIDGENRSKEGWEEAV